MAHLELQRELSGISLNLGVRDSFVLAVLPSMHPNQPNFLVVRLLVVMEKVSHLPFGKHFSLTTLLFFLPQCETIDVKSTHQLYPVWIFLSFPQGDANSFFSGSWNPRHQI